jgi:DNA-binding CsgD family transcriptional regulator
MKSLSPRERMVVEMLVGGLSQKEVACRLSISVRTVSGYLRRVQRKTGQPTVIAAVAYVIVQGIVLVNSA